MNKRGIMVILGLVCAVLSLICFGVSFWQDADQNWFFSGVTLAAAAFVLNMATNQKKDKKEEEDKRRR